ncbi:MAG: response regulator [Syntrophobacterales bacterium]|nr:response regulator [Syntrophobacterales bacterium]
MVNPATPVSPRKVVVVNDDPVQLRLLAAILGKEGLQVGGAAGVPEALALMEQEGPPDLLVTDLHMPGIDGWRFCRLLRSAEYPAYRHIPILVVSATFAGVDAREITRDLGADAFLSLPCSAAELKAVVHSLLSGRTPTIRPRVLIVEDSPTLSRLLERTFRESGYQVRTALTGAEARHQWEDFSPELIILDYHLPDVAGDRLLQEFATGKTFPAIIMITTDTDPSLAMHFLRMGADAYLRKPFDPRYLVELSFKVRRERALLRVEDILEARTRELQESQARLRESEERYRLLVENIPGVVFTRQADGALAFYDAKIEALTGYPQEDFHLGRRSWEDLILPEDREPALLPALPAGQPRVREYRIRTRSGEVRWIQERSQLLSEPEGQPLTVQGILFDITERKRQEEERLKLDKLEALGILAGGIAHDFNNLLTALVGNVTLVSLTPGLPAAAQQSLAAAEQACLRAQGLAQQLLTFAKGGTPVKQATGVAPLLNEALTLALAGSSSRAHVHLAPDLWAADVDPGQIRQALQDILINAHQAMPGGGLITITADNLRLTADAGLPLAPGPYVRVAISDQGPGIDPALLGKIFDPYFTTKSGGSGLGLATAFSILQKHGGYLTASSTPGEGATFTLYLPAVLTAAAHRPPAPAAPTSGPPGGRLLLLEDDPQVADVARRMLEHLGYQVECVPEGGQALTAYRQAQTRGSPFDAVILDLTVPGGMGGKEAVEKLRELDPRVVAIVTSGYAEDPILTHYERYGFRGVLKKPYRVQEMANLLRRVLHRDEAAPA